MSIRPARRDRGALPCTTPPSTVPVSGRRLLAAAAAFAAGIAAGSQEGAAALPVTAALLALGCWPRRPEGRGGAAPPAGRRPVLRAAAVILPTVCLAAAFAAGAGASRFAAWRAPGPALLAAWRVHGFDDHESPVRLEGRVEDVERSGDDRVTLLFRARRAAFPAGDPCRRLGRPVRLRLGVPWPATNPIPWRPGDRIEVTARVGAARRYGNPGSFDYPASLEARGIALTGSVKNARLVRPLGPPRPAWRGGLARLRRRIVSTLTAAAPASWPDAAPFLAALLVGERQDLAADLEERLQAAGVYHVVALSGFNVACVAAGAAALLSLLPGGPRTRRLALLGVIALYGGLARPSGSIARAALMVLVHGLGLLAGRRTSPSGSIAVSALLLLAHRPSWLAEPGFQLSYAATLGLFAAPGRGGRRAGPSPSGRGRALAGTGWSFIAGVAGASLAALVATAPLAARHFHRVSPAGLPANLVAVPASAACLLLGFVALAAAPALPQIATHTIALAGVLLEAIDRTAAACARLPAGSLWVVPPAWTLVIALFAAMTAARGAPRVWTRRAAAAVALLLAAGLLARGRLDTPRGGSAAAGRMEVVAIDVGQGDAVLVRTPAGATVLVDAGGLGGMEFDVGARVVAPALRAMGLLRLDIVAVTHAHRDHIGGAAAILSQFRPAALWLGALPADNPAVRGLEATAAHLGIVVLRPRRGVRIHLGGARFDVAHPGGAPRGGLRPNNQSLVLRVSHGRRAVLLTGDIEAEVERDLLAAGVAIAADLLKVPHHGSDSSSGEAFLRAVAPRVALISAGAGNPWGHPSEPVLERLARLGARVGRTDRDGALRARTDGLTPWRLTTWAPPRPPPGVSEDLWGHRDETEDEDQESEEGHQQPPAPERRHVVERAGMADADDREQHPEQDEVIAADQQPEGAHGHDAGARHDAMRPRRHGVQHVPAVELADRQEVERGGEQPEPGGGERRVQPHRSLRTDREEEGIEPVEQEAGRQADVTGVRRLRGDRGVRQPVEQDRDGGHEPGDRPGHADVEQRLPGGERRADADHGAECPEQVRTGQKERQRGIDPVQAAGDVVPHLVGPENEQGAGRVRQPVDPGRGPPGEGQKQRRRQRHAPGHQSAGEHGRDHGGDETGEVDPGRQRPHPAAPEDAAQGKPRPPRALASDGRRRRIPGICLRVIGQTT